MPMRKPGYDGHRKAFLYDMWKGSDILHWPKARQWVVHISASKALGSVALTDLEAPITWIPWWRWKWSATWNKVISLKPSIPISVPLQKVGRHRRKHAVAV
jgi:hypothetical protein